MGVLWVLRMFFDHGITRYRMRTLKGSIRFMCGHGMGPFGFHTALGTSIRWCMRAPYGPVWMPYMGLGISIWLVGTRWSPYVHLRIMCYLTHRDKLVPQQHSLWPTFTKAEEDHIYEDCAYSTFSHWKYGTLKGPNIFETLCGQLPMGSHGFGPYGAWTAQRASCDLGIKHLMLR